MASEAVKICDTNSRKPALMVIGAGFLWGIIGVFSNTLSSLGFTPIQITEGRCAVSAICLLIFLLIKNRNELKINIKDIWMFLGTGICSIAFFNICYFTCINMTSLSAAAILLYTSPCFVMVLSCILFNEKFTFKKLISLLLAFIGCGAVSGVFSSEMNMTPLGFLVGIGSGLGYGLYSIFGRFALKKYSSTTIIFYTFVVAAIFLIPFCNIGDMAENIFTNAYSALNTVLLGSMSTMLPFLLYTSGLSKMDTGKAAVLAFVEPMTATIVSAVIFKEVLTFMSITGILLIIISVLILSRN